MKINTTYPDIKDRIKAAFFDTIILVFSMFIISDIFLRFENVPNEFRLTAFILIFGLYDPIAVCFFGGTFGHHINKIKIKRIDNINKNLFLHMAIIRFLTKATLGWFSFLIINSSSKKRAMHDVLSGSVVLFKEN